MLGAKKSLLFVLTSLVLMSGVALGLAYRWAFHDAASRAEALSLPESGSSESESQLLVSTAAASVEEQPLVFLTSVVDLGSQKNKVEHTFELANRGARPVTIVRVTPSCSCTATQPDRKTLGAGEKCTVRATVDLRSQLPGYHRYSLEVFYQDPTPKSTRAEFTVLNNPDVQVTPLELSLVLVGNGHPKGSIGITDYREKPLEISSLETSSKRIRARIAQRPQLYLPGWKFLLEVEPSEEPLPAGSYHELLTVRTSDPKAPELKIPVHLQKIDRVRLAPLRLTLRRPTDQPEGPFSGKLFLSDTQGEGIEVESIEADSDRLAWRFEKKHSPGNQVIKVVLQGEKGRAISSFQGKLTIRVKKPCPQKFELPVSCLGASEPG